MWLIKLDETEKKSVNIRWKWKTSRVHHEGTLLKLDFDFEVEHFHGKMKNKLDKTKLNLITR